MPATIQLPQELYEAVQEQAAAEEKTTDTLIAEWIAERLGQSEATQISEAFVEEVAAFEQLRPALLEEYEGQYVAIYQGEMVASGEDKLALLHRVRERFGHVVCYIERVAPDSPRTVRAPSFRVARS
jgi:hypothetical protein